MAFDTPSTQPPESRGSSVCCFKCGYPLQGVAIGSQCPECGTPVDVSYRSSGGLGASGYAIASLVLGILAIPGLCAYVVPGAIFGVIGLRMATLAKKEIEEGRAAASSIGLMTAGKVCSLVALVPATILLVMIAAYLIAQLIADLF